MKFRNILNITGLFLLFILLTPSCVSEIAEDGDRTIPAPEGEAYFSVQIKTGDEFVYSRSNGEIDGDAAELKVHSVRVVLYDGNESSATLCKAEYVFDFDLQTPESWDTPENATNWITDRIDKGGEVNDNHIIPSGNHLSPKGRSGYQFATFAQRVKDKPYKMLVILNGQDKDKSFSSPIYQATNRNNYLYIFNHEVMNTINSATGVLEDGKGILMTNHQGLVEIKQGRLGKTIDEAHDDPVEVSVDRLVAKVTVKHAEDFKFPKGIDPESVTWGLDITNRYYYWMRVKAAGEKEDPTMKSLYATDPNYDVLPAQSNKSNYFDYISVIDGDYTSIQTGSINNKPEEYEYIPENTIDVGSKEFSEYEDQLTRVIIGYKYTPDGFGQDDSYYIYKNKAISQEEMNKYIADDQYSIPGLDGLRDILDNINKQKYPIDGTGKDFYEIDGFRFCPEGQLYYIIPIQHFGESSSLGYYGVVRNNIYDITINSLVPPDLAGPYMSAEIHIQPWAQRSQGNKIGVSVTESKYAPVKVFHWSIKENRNLYPDWWVNETGGALIDAPEYQTSMRRLGANVNGSTFTLNMLDINYHIFSSSTPDNIIVSENPKNNVLTLLYWQGTINASGLPNVAFCFVDEEGHILDLAYRENNVETDNPASMMMPIEVYSETPTIGRVYIQYLTSIYIPSKAGEEYRIKDVDFARYYKNLSSTQVQFNSGFLTEPIAAATKTGNNWYGDGSNPIAIICVKK